nr:autotransporter outer membrane beta-barrel domain-containing protein [Microvirga puerhi]
MAQNGSIIAPGNSIGTLNVAGNVTLATSSIYQVAANANGSSDLVKASGTAIINGASVQVIAAQGDYRPRTAYTILTATGGVTGRFGDIFTNLAFLMPELTYGTNAVTLTLVRNDTTFSGIAATQSQASIGGAVDRAIRCGNPIYNALIGATAAEARTGLGSLSGEIHARAVTAMLEDSRLVRNAALSRLRQGPSSTSGQGPVMTGAYTADQPARAPSVAPIAVVNTLPNAFGVKASAPGNKLRVMGTQLPSSVRRAGSPSVPTRRSARSMVVPDGVV